MRFVHAINRLQDRVMAKAVILSDLGVMIEGTLSVTDGPKWKPGQKAMFNCLAEVETVVALEVYEVKRRIKRLEYRRDFGGTGV